MTTSPLSQATAAAVLVASMLGCSHSEPFGTGTDALAVPLDASQPSRLTYNAGDNYWPSWTEDGKGIIYTYSYPQPDLHADDRCLGLLPPTGGTRLWQLCDERGTHADSADSFAAAAIGTDGRLVYLEASSRRGPGGLSGANPPPQTTNLWLADTTFPFQRRALLQLGALISGQFVNWFRDTHWTGQSSFVSLAQFDKLDPHPLGALIDSVFIGLGVVRAEITPTGATFTIVPGTEGAQMYAIAENGASFIIYRSGSLLERVPMAGGLPTTVATLPVGISGLTCQGSTCLVTTGRPGTPQSIYRVMLATGEAIPFAISISDSPRLPPTGGTIVGRNGRTLYLFSGLLP